MSQLSITAAELDRWANDPNGPIALHLKERLVPVEGEGAVFFPPTFAKIGYNIDTLEDGTKVALVDSVGAQANRIEPIFESEKYKALVPQINIKYNNGKSGEDHYQGEISIFRLGHRLGDAVVRSTDLRDTVIKPAFKALLQSGDASHIARLAPTSLVFGVWDSRGSMAKVPRLLQSTVRAWNVSPLKRSAQYKAALEIGKFEVLAPMGNKMTDAHKEEYSSAGFLDAPATLSHGGVVAHGPILRDLTINLVALRRLRGDREKELRQYILGLCLVAAAEPVDAFYRQGCLLVPHADFPAEWTLVERNGTRTKTALNSTIAFEFAQKAAKEYGVEQKPRVVEFSKDKAKEEVEGKKDKGEAGEGKRGKKGK